jgi:hypothetical protein
MAKHSAHILQLARQGAQARLRELRDEVRLLLSAFPDLRDAFDEDELPVSFIMKRDGGGGVKADARATAPDRTGAGETSGRARKGARRAAPRARKAGDR